MNKVLYMYRTRELTGDMMTRDGIEKKGGCLYESSIKDIKKMTYWYRHRRITVTD